MRRVMVVIGVLALLARGGASAKDFYADGSIVTGDLWDSVYIHDTPPSHTTVNMTGGEVFGGLYTYEGSRFNLSAGKVNAMTTYDNSFLNMTSGTLSHLYSYWSSTASISAGTLNNLSSYELSTANISGNNPDVPFDIYAWDQSIINFSGTAQALEVQALSNARINVTGGEITDLSAYSNGVVNIYAGDISHLWAQDNAAINIFGYDLFKSPSGGTGNGFVSGYFNDHSYFNFNFDGTATYSHVNLIPEPATILLLVAGGLFLRKKE
jgi:hypothetical protein